MKIWLTYKVAMVFWINIYGCQPYPRHGPLKVNQIKTIAFFRHYASFHYRMLNKILFRQFKARINQESVPPSTSNDLTKTRTSKTIYKALKGNGKLIHCPNSSVSMRKWVLLFFGDSCQNDF